MNNVNFHSAFIATVAVMVYTAVSPDIPPGKLGILPAIVGKPHIVRSGGYFIELKPVLNAVLKCLITDKRIVSPIHEENTDIGKRYIAFSGRFFRDGRKDTGNGGNLEFQFRREVKR